MLKLINILENIILESKIESLKKDYVDSGKITQDVFDLVINSSVGQYGYALWLIKRVIDNIILPEDLYKYEKYFKVFDRFKKKFPSNDIFAYKTSQQVKEFVLKCIEIIDTINVGTDSGSDDNLVSGADILKLKEFGIKLIGMVDGYQCFKVPQKLADNETAYKVYKKILGDAGGKTIEICTMGSFSHFQNHLKEDDFYVFFNKSDDLSPYQFGYVQEQFKDRNDTEYVYENYE